MAAETKKLKRRLSVCLLFVFLTFAAVPALEKSAARAATQNEMRVIAVLRNLASWQAQFQSARILDADADGRGEYGSFADLAGTKPPLIRGELARGTSLRAVHSGYVFRMDLSEDSETRELTFACYAWPVEYGKTGHRAFFVNELGELLATSNFEQRYSGERREPETKAALLTGSKPEERVLAKTAEGFDGQQWTNI